MVLRSIDKCREVSIREAATLGGHNSCSECIVGNSYLGITSGLLVIRPESAEQGTAYKLTPKEHHPFCTGMS